jgi:hypothetical protein
MKEIIKLLEMAYICLSLIAIIGLYFTAKHYKQDRNELLKILNNHGKHISRK